MELIFKGNSGYKAMKNGNEIWDGHYTSTPAKKIEPFWVISSYNNGTIKVNGNGLYIDHILNAGGLQCSADGITWWDMKQYGSGNSARTFASNTDSHSGVPAYTKMYLRIKTPITYWSAASDSRDANVYLTCDRDWSFGGSPLSLLYGPNFDGTQTSFPDETLTGIFSGLFWENDSNIYDHARYISRGVLTEDDKFILPSGNLVNRCFHSMFRDNKPNLKDLSFVDISGTRIGTRIMDAMCMGHSSLQKSPNIYVSDCGGKSIENAFWNCGSLTEIRCHATVMDGGNFTSGVAASGTFYKKAGVTWPTGGSGIPSGWTVVEE